MNAIVSKLASWTSLSIGGLMIVLFFLPWVSVHCGMMRVAEASGWELTTGSISPSSQMEQQAANAGESDEKDDPSDDIDARPWFAMGLVVPALLVLAGAGILGGSRNGGVILILGALGLVVMILATQVDYATDLTQNAQKDKQPEAGPSTQNEINFGPSDQQMQAMAQQMIQTKTTGVVILGIAAYVVAMICGVAKIVIPPPTRRRGVQVLSETTTDQPPGSNAGEALAAMGEPDSDPQTPAPQDDEPAPPSL